MANNAGKGHEALEQKNCIEAVYQYTLALKQMPRAVMCFIGRSTAWQRMSSGGFYDRALKDADAATMLAYQRGQRELIEEAQYRRALALYGLERFVDAKFCVDIYTKLKPGDMKAIVLAKKIQSELDARPAEKMQEASVVEKPEIDSDELIILNISDIPPTQTELAAKLQALVEPTRKSKTEDPAASPSKTVSEKRVESSPQTTVEPEGSAQQSAPKTLERPHHDWYQSGSNVSISLYDKYIKPETLSVELEERSVSVSYERINGSTYDFTLDPLFETIDAKKSSYSLAKTKLELNLRKTTPRKWSALETSEALPASSAPAHTVPSAVSAGGNVATTSSVPASHYYPTSSRHGPKDWDKLAADLTKKPSRDPSDPPGEEDYDELNEFDPDPATAFFKQLYANSDPDTRRAMVKSFQESNGTALSTDWNSVSQDTVQTLPPDGCEVKKF